MIVRTIEMLLEYLCIVLCLYKVAKVRFKFNPWLIIIFIEEFIVFELINRGQIPKGYNFIVIVSQFVFVKSYLCKSWKKTIVVYGTMLLSIMALQLLFYAFFKILAIDNETIQNSGILVNGMIFALLLFGKEKYIIFIAKKLNIIKEEIITLTFLLILFRIIYLGWRDKLIDFELGMQFLIETIVVCIVSALWLNAENEKELKKKEIQMYETYNKAFEETIMTIKIRQHEFENHINAIKSLSYTIKDSEELVRMQEEYCASVLEESRMSKLLNQELNPIIIEFLYSKITNAEEKGIKVEFQIQPVDITGKIEAYEFVEIIGILFDNAMEALKDMKDKRILLKLMKEEGDAFFLEIANRSREYRNEELEKFCMRGYSSKGKNRGVGLTRVKEIVERNKAELLIRNVTVDDDNYLSFQVDFKKLR